jgi:hypothetical protein
MGTLLKQTIEFILQTAKSTYVLLGCVALFFLAFMLYAVITNYLNFSYWSHAYEWIYLALTYGLWGFLQGHSKLLVLAMVLLLSLLASLAIVPLNMTEFAAIIGVCAGRTLRVKSTQVDARIISILNGTCVSALAIVLVFGLFALPKVMTAPYDSQNTAIAKEAASMIAGAFSAYDMPGNQITSKTAAKELIQFMNYVKIDTSTRFGSGLKNGHVALQSCSPQLPCLRLHNGGILQYDAQQTYGGTATTNAIFFNLDPDGEAPNGRVSFYQYANGRIRTGETKLPGTFISGGTLTSQDQDPEYLQDWE